MNAWLLLLTYFIYGLISIYLFIISSAGYTQLIVFLLWTAFYIVTSVILLVIIIKLRSMNISTVYFTHKLIFTLLFFQIMTILFNTGDAGDSSSCVPFFIERIINTYLSCNIIPLRLLSYLFAIAYIFSILEFLRSVAEQKPQSRKQLH